jgi:hypothetical protein
MAKVELNMLINGIRGKVDKAVLRKYKGRTIMGRLPESDGELSAAQIAHNKRFQEAVDFGKFILSDDTVRPLYEQAAEQRGMPIMAVCVADFFNAPGVTTLETMNYKGKVGDPILIVASDDFGVVKVNVQISDDDTGVLIEEGAATETPSGSGHWTYIATQPVAAGMMVQFQAAAFDRPGGMGTQRCAKRI